MKKVFITLISLLCLGTAYAADVSSEGIYVWVNGSYTCYKYESQPEIRISNNQVTLTVNDGSAPELTLDVADLSNLEVTTGEYTPTAIKSVTELKPVTKNGKYITGGKLVILKNGKKYDINGTEIK